MQRRVIHGFSRGWQKAYLSSWANGKSWIKSESFDCARYHKRMLTLGLSLCVHRTAIEIQRHRIELKCFQTQCVYLVHGPRFGKISNGITSCSEHFQLGAMRARYFDWTQIEFISLRRFKFGCLIKLTKKFDEDDDDESKVLSLKTWKWWLQAAMLI